MAANDGFIEAKLYLQALSIFSKNPSFDHLKSDIQHYLIKQIVKHNAKQSSNEMKKEIEMNAKHTDKFFNDKLFKSTDFINVLQLFDSIMIELIYPSKLYDLEFNEISEIYNKYTQRISISVTVLSISKETFKFGLAQL